MLRGELEHDRAGIVGVVRFGEREFRIYVHFEDISSGGETVNLNELAWELRRVLVFPSYGDSLVIVAVLKEGRSRGRGIGRGIDHAEALLASGDELALSDCGRNELSVYSAAHRDSQIPISYPIAITSEGPDAIVGEIRKVVFNFAGIQIEQIRAIRRVPEDQISLTDICRASVES